MEPSELPTHDFLLIRYDHLDFLVDRNQFSGSTSLDDLFPVQSGLPYLSHWGWYNKERLLMFDMNRYLMELYQCGQLGESRLCLIIQLKDFQEPGRQFLQRILKQSKRLSQNYMGLIISSQAEIQTLNLAEFSLSPWGIRPLLKKRGFYGCRFPEEAHAQFFVDLQKYLFYALESAGEASRQKGHAGA